MVDKAGRIVVPKKLRDTPHMACARKIGAEQIYTWNARRFRMIEPDLADRIITP